jgi:hypothetical protein
VDLGGSILRSLFGTATVADLQFTQHPRQTEGEGGRYITFVK